MWFSLERRRAKGAKEGIDAESAPGSKYMISCIMNNECASLKTNPNEKTLWVALAHLLVIFDLNVAVNIY
jgi:hypothetical protein